MYGTDERSTDASYICFDERCELIFLSTLPENSHDFRWWIISVNWYGLQLTFWFSAFILSLNSWVLIVPLVKQCCLSFTQLIQQNPRAFRCWLMLRYWTSICFISEVQPVNKPRGVTCHKDGSLRGQNVITVQNTLMLFHATSVLNTLSSVRLTGSNQPLSLNTIKILLRWDGGKSFPTTILIYKTIYRKLLWNFTNSPLVGSLWWACDILSRIGVYRFRWQTSKLLNKLITTPAVDSCKWQTFATKILLSLNVAGYHRQRISTR